MTGTADDKDSLAVPDKEQVPAPGVAPAHGESDKDKDFQEQLPDGSRLGSLNSGESLAQKTIAGRGKFQQPKPTSENTNLDMDAYRAVVGRMFQDKEVQLHKQMQSGANKFVKHDDVFTDYNWATPCSSVWATREGTDRVHFCEKCKLQVYYLVGLDSKEIDSLIFQREGRNQVKLYRRQDGMFLTSDCPLGRKQQQSIFIAGLLAVLCMAGAIYLLTLTLTLQSNSPKVTRLGSLTKPEMTKVKVDNFKIKVIRPVLSNNLPTSSMIQSTPGVQRSSGFKIRVIRSASATKQQTDKPEVPKAVSGEKMSPGFKIKVIRPAPQPGQQPQVLLPSSPGGQLNAR